MAFGFLTASAYAVKIKGLEKRIQAFESGSAYTTLQRELDAAHRENDRLTKEMLCEKLHYAKEMERMSQHWMDAMEDVRKQCEQQLQVKDREIDTLKERIVHLEEKVQQLKSEKQEALENYYAEKVERDDAEQKLKGLQAKIDKDYSNSSKSSSASPNHPVIPNNREKTDRKPGAQPGHDHAPRKRLTPTKTICLDPPEEYLDEKRYKRMENRTVVKQLICVHLHVEAIDYVAPVYRNLETGSYVHPDFPEGLHDDVTYDGSVKAAAFLLNHHCHASIDKTAAYLREMSNGQLNLSKGFINQLTKAFSEATESERTKYFLKLAAADVLHTDFSFSRANGKTATVAVNCTDDTVLYQARPSKGKMGVQGTPAEVNSNTIVSDHESSLIKLGSKHQDCLDHVSRYLKGSIDNEPNLKWNTSTLSVIQEMRHYRNGLGPEDPLDPEIVAGLEKKLKAALLLGKKEYEDEPPSKYYRDGYNLWKRMYGDMNEYVLFLHDKNVSPSNSVAERAARDYKRASAASMGYRSDKAHELFCDSLSIIKTHTLRGDNLFDYIAEKFGVINNVTEQKG